MSQAAENLSRIAKRPVAIPSGVECKVVDRVLTVKGKQGELKLPLHDAIAVNVENNEAQIVANDPNHDNLRAMSGTTAVLVSNMIKGVSEGFVRKLQLVGVGYRAKVQGNIVDLTLGFSHPVNFPIPTGITIETPSNTEIVIKGADKQLVGQVAANIRAIRPPEPYKGKGVRYSDERVIQKQTKKK